MRSLRFAGSTCFARAIGLAASVSAGAFFAPWPGHAQIGFISTFSGQFADAATQMDNGVKSPDGLVNVEFDKVENAKDPVNARMGL